MTTHYYEDPYVTVHHGDCIEVMRSMADASVDAVITDPPYELGFMGATWDKRGVAFDPATWAECLRILKPGGYLIAFGGSRTWHRLVCAVEDAGFEIRDSIAWLYGSGFPKTLNVANAIDKLDASEAHTPEAAQWSGWGTALKPAFEPIVVGRKPLDGTVAANVLAHGTGALNIDACRVGDVLLPESAPRGVSKIGTFDGSAGNTTPERVGRWPTNVVLDESQASELDQQTGTSTSRKGKPRTGKRGDDLGMTATGTEYVDKGGVSRYFPTFHYEAKAPSKERPEVDGVRHPTVKPLALMRWLVRLVAPRGAIILDPFAGSGTTLEAALAEGVVSIGIEREDRYLPLIRQRLAKDSDTPLDFGGIA